MMDYFVDVGHQSHNKHGELLCGDHVEIIRQGENGLVMVLADGLGSGVKANILSTLTAKIISTMMANDMDIADCIAAIAATLPVCEVRKVAYSTFTVIQITDQLEASIIQFDNPHIILLRNGHNLDYPMISERVEGKIVYKSQLKLTEGDVLISTSDGAIHAGVGKSLNFGWLRKDIIDYMERAYRAEYTAKMLTTILSDQCLLLYGGEPGDDTTVCTVKVRKRKPVNLLMGPPANPADVPTMMALFFSKEGKRIVCGGTTSQLVAEYLTKPLVVDLPVYHDSDVPPMAKIEGIDAVTEGVVTFSKALFYAKNYMGDNDLYGDWSRKKDGASEIAKLLIEEATDINFFVGRAINPAHQNPNLPITFSIKMRLVDEFADLLRQMGKHIKISYF
jgi:Serine phosphatase RsbU, regulator of sigma subunit